jgi:hypothetical protein
MSIKPKSTESIQNKVQKVRALAGTAPMSVRDELLQQIDDLEKSIDKLTRRTKDERERAVETVLNSISAMHPADARKYITETFNTKFFKEEYDVRFKEDLATALYNYCKTSLNWENAYLKKQAFIL